MFSARSEPTHGSAPQGAAAAAGGWMSSVFSMVRNRVEEAVSPRVVQPSETSAGRSWESSSGVIRTSELTRESCNRHISLCCIIRNCFSLWPENINLCLAWLSGEHARTARRCCCRLGTSLLSLEAVGLRPPPRKPKSAVGENPPLQFRIYLPTRRSCHVRTQTGGGCCRMQALHLNGTH